MHNREEIEFWDVYSFKSLDAFLPKTNTYILWFNILRPNKYKENQTIIQIAKIKIVKISKTIAMLPSVILDPKIKGVKNLDLKIKYMYKNVYDIL